MVIFVFAVRAYAADSTTDEQAFRDGLMASYEEEFSAYSSGDTEIPPLAFSDAAYSFEATSVSAGGVVPSDSLYFGEGGGYSGTAITLVEDTDRLRFTEFAGGASGVTAVGGVFFLTDVNEDLLSGTVTVTATFSDDSTLVETLNSPAPGGELPFLGFVAEGGVTITSLEVAPDSGAVSYASTGNLIVGTQIPEPATVVLWSGLGVFFFAVALRRRRKGAARPA